MLYQTCLSKPPYVSAAKIEIFQVSSLAIACVDKNLFSRITSKSSILIIMWCHCWKIGFTIKLEMDISGLEKI